MTMACARLSEAKAGLTGSVTMRSASATSSFSSPLRSRPNTIATVSPAAIRGAISPRRLGRSDHGLGLIVGARGRRQHEAAVGNRLVQRVVELGAVEDAVGAGRHHPRLVVRPALPRLDQAQPRQAEIGHGARGRADILAKLRLDQDHHRRRLLDPALGLVGAGARHAVLLGGQMP